MQTLNNYAAAMLKTIYLYYLVHLDLFEDRMFLGYGLGGVSSAAMQTSRLPYEESQLAETLILVLLSVVCLYWQPS